jgi:DAACS family dicarboxylate/amino acid:cation (Na+ or H+) symporter
MLIGFCVGAGLGLTANAFIPGSASVTWTIDHLTMPAGQIFLRLLFMLVVPVLFSALVMGVCELDTRHLGRLGLKTLAYTIVVSALAVGIGLFLVNVLAPGEGLPQTLREAAKHGPKIDVAKSPPDISLMGLIINMVPVNPVRSAADGDMVGLIIFSIAIGLGIQLVRSQATDTLKDAIQGLFDVAMRLIELVLKLAPLGIAALMFTATSRLGFALLRQLGAYVIVVILGLAIHMLVVYSLSVWALGRMSPITFFKGVRAAIATAFATASSNATLPTALKVADEELHLPTHVSRFVLTAGATMNQNGTALFEGVTVLFLAQLYGVELSMAQQVFVMGACIVAGIGTAGVPAGSLPVIAVILGALKIPVEGLGLILGVDRILDMCRTVLNVTGDLAAAVSVARGESEITPTA